MKQKYTSEKTSRNQIAAGFKKVGWKAGSVNLDIGGGKYDKASNYLYNTHRVLNMIYDPFCRSDESNNKTIWNQNRYNTCTIFNTLNVIQEQEIRLDLLQLAKNLVRHGGEIYITVYEGSKDYVAKATRDGWQNNASLKSYFEEIREIFPHTVMKNGMITCINTNE